MAEGNALVLNEGFSYLEGVNMGVIVKSGV